jgi:hypothetical protein
MRYAYLALGVFGAIAVALSCSSGTGGNGAGPDAGGSGGAGGSEGKDAGSIVEEKIGPSGGAVLMADGTGVKIPKGALTSDITISIENAPAAPPVKASQGSSAGPTLKCSPEGTTFKKPVTVILAFDSSDVPNGKSAKDVVIVTSPVKSPSYTALPTSVSADGAHVQAATTHFSYFRPILPQEVRDAAAPTDSSIEGDAEPPTDAPEDAGLEPDATAIDGGFEPDVAFIDSGLALDAAFADSGVAVDAGSVTDAAADVGIAHDASAIDSGIAVDAGAMQDAASVALCSGAGSSAAGCEQFDEPCSGGGPQTNVAVCSSSGFLSCSVSGGATLDAGYVGCVCGSTPPFTSTGGFSCAIGSPTGGSFEACQAACGF